MTSEQGTILIVGAGVAGVRAALELAQAGRQVCLIDTAPNIGGTLSQLDNQFPTNHCGMCKMLPTLGRSRVAEFCLRRSLNHPNITVMPHTELTALEGWPGAFQVTLRKAARYVDPARCTACGVCAQVCPVEIPDAFNAPSARRKAPSPDSTPPMAAVPIVPSQGTPSSPGTAAVALRTPDSELRTPNPNLRIAEKTPGVAGVEITRLRKAIGIRYPLAIPNAYSIDMQACTKCGACVEKCPTRAIDLAARESTATMQVGAVVLSTGFDEFDPAPLGQFGYGRFPNVVTSIEFERLLSGMGPTGGALLRPSDGKPVKTIAFLQCVGSRERKRDFCSSACCMYAMKEAMLAKDLDSTIQAAVFFMDMRAFGREYHKYYERAKKEYGVEFVRCRVSRVRQRASTKDLELSAFMADGNITKREFDLVVLSVGQTPSKGSARLLETLGVQANEWGFCRTSEASPVRTSREGVFVCGSLAGPKDIRDSMTEACAAAAEAASVGKLEVGTRKSEQVSDGSLFRVPTSDFQVPSPNFRVPASTLPKTGHAQAGVSCVPPPSAPSHKPRVGVFVCACGGEIGRKLDTGKLVEWSKMQRDVELATELGYLCFDDDLKEMVEAAKSQAIDRVAIAACVPYGFKAKFERALADAGVAPEFVRVVNVREHVAWVHDDVAAATEKATALVGAAIAQLRYELPSIPGSEQLDQGVVVVGGGLCGMACASALAALGFDVHLVEKGKTLCGNAADIRHTLDNPDFATVLNRARADIESNKRVHVHLESEVVAVQGHVGGFVSTLSVCSKPRRPQPEWRSACSDAQGGADERRVAASDGASDSPATQISSVPHASPLPLRRDVAAAPPEGEGTTLEIKHGALVIATGGREHVPSSYLFGKDERIVTQHAFEKMLFEPGFEKRDIKSVVMIQCVESRDEKRPYCSRICCSQALKNARRLRELKPDAQVVVLNRDLMSYGFREQWYTKARDNGVSFVRYEPERKPEVSAKEGKLHVSVTDPYVAADFTFEPDLLVLSTGVEPNDTAPLARALGLELDCDGFFSEAEVKFRPQDFLKEGVFVCGLAAGPCGIREALAQAGSAAQRVVAALAQGTTHPARVVSEVNERRCAGCEMCIAMCPYSARVKDPRKRIARVLEAQCQGCGVCATVCPSGATKIRGLSDKQVFAALDAVLT
ncbi:MAG: FAD-dependent oxidoreductase [Planctomycetota bacterium]|nr:FAD-dependent oxidoreductase [Planctomycetota bacterium]